MLWWETSFTVAWSFTCSSLWRPLSWKTYSQDSPKFPRLGFKEKVTVSHVFLRLPRLFPFKKPVVSAGEVICFPEASAQVLAIVLKKTPAKIGGKWHGPLRWYETLAMGWEQPDSLPSTFLRKHPGHTARQNNQRGHGGIGDASNGTFRRHYGVPNSVVEFLSMKIIFQWSEKSTEPLMCLLCLCHERLP